MATYKFYDGSINGLERQQTAFATPGQSTGIVVRRGFVDTTKQTLTGDTDIGQAIPLAKNEVVLGVWIRLETAETSGNAEFSVGLDADNEYFMDPVLATPANLVATEFGLGVAITSNNQAITIFPNNGVDLDTAVIEVCALVSTSLNSDGDLPDSSYAYKLV